MAFKTDTIFNENEGAKLIRSEILNIVNENVFAAGLDPVAEALGFQMENLTERDGVFTSMLGAQGLTEIGEFDEFPILNKEQGFEKGYKVTRFGGKLAISKALRKWIEASARSPKLDATVKTELQKLANATQELVDSVKITKNERVTEVLANGFVADAPFWPWSASPDGKALFATDHIIKSTGATQSNLVTGALTQAKLEEAIGLLRDMKNGRGRTMKIPNEYTLIVSRKGEANARRILNEGSKSAAEVLGTPVSNDITSNIFTWDGFRINLMVLETLGQPKIDGTVVGSDTMWFLVNKDAANALGAFKYLNLYSEEMDMWEDKATKVVYIDVDLSFNADHYNPEVIVGSLGV